MRVLYLGLFLLLFSSCVSVKAIDYADWQTSDFEWVGLRLEIPNEIYPSESKYDVPKVFMQLYPLKRPKFVIDDTIYRIKITIKRETLTSFEKNKLSYLKSGLYKRSNEKERELWLWILKAHEQFKCRDDGQYSYCRKDVVVENGELFSGEVEILNAGWNGKGERDQALKVVERIMNSIKPLK